MLHDAFMASSSESTTPVVSFPSVEEELRDICKTIRDHKWYLLQMDEEGGHRFEMADKYLIQIHEEFVVSISQSK